MKAFQYRINPSKSQKTLFKLWFRVSKEVWNQLLEFVKSNWENHQINNSSKFKLINKLTELKKLPEFQHWNRIHSQVLQNICDRLSKAFQAFFRRIKNKETPGYPRFKGKFRRINSICFPEVKSGFKITDTEIFLPKKFFKNNGIKNNSYGGNKDLNIPHS